MEELEESVWSVVRQENEREDQGELFRLDLERTGSVGELLTDCAQGWAVRKQ